MNKPTLPKGTRDFGPVQMVKRQYIIETIRKVFQKYGYKPLETPAMENLSTLTGKYGDEGDKLMYKILNSGDFMKGVAEPMPSSAEVAPQIADKGLRYDLTVPFARFVVMNQNELSFPFRRYQIQPVWRADRPQKGRYREFYQCDADVVGTDSLLCEAEVVGMISEVFTLLKLDQYAININNRKILTGITEVIDAAGKEADFCVAIDKLDKAGADHVKAELQEKGFSDRALHKLNFIFEASGKEILPYLKDFLQPSDMGMEGIREVEEVMRLLNIMQVDATHLQFDVTLARGLSYYTGAIFEVKMKNVAIGSVGGGGRYDDLTSVFGLSGLSGIGFSFGIDRLYDVLEALDLFPSGHQNMTQLLLVHFDQASFEHGLQLLHQLRQEGIATEIYPDTTKLKKQLNYANKTNVPYVLLIGEEEMKSGSYTLKNMIKGEQQQASASQIAALLKQP